MRRPTLPLLVLTRRSCERRNLLQASSGVKVNQVRGLNFFADQSRVREFFTMPIVHQPGTY